MPLHNLARARSPWIRDLHRLGHCVCVVGCAAAAAGIALGVTGSPLRALFALFAAAVALALGSYLLALPSCARCRRKVATAHGWSRCLLPAAHEGRCCP